MGKMDQTTTYRGAVYNARNSECTLKVRSFLASLMAVSVMTSHNLQTFPQSLALCEGNPPVTSVLPAQRASDAEL